MLSYRTQPVTLAATQTAIQTASLARTQTQAQVQAVQAQRQQQGAGQQAYRYRTWSGSTGAVPGVENMPPAHSGAHRVHNIRKRAPVLTLEGCGHAGAGAGPDPARQDKAAMEAVPGTDEVLSSAAKPLHGKMAKPAQDRLQEEQDTEKQAAMEKLYRQKTMMQLRSMIPLLENTGGAVRRLFMETCYSLKNEHRLREETERAQEAREVPKAPPAACNADNAETLSCSFSPRF